MVKVVAWLLSAVLLVAGAAAGESGCPGDRRVLGSRLWQGFSGTIEEHYLVSGGLEATDLSPKQWAKLLGYALSRQARYVQGDEQRRVLFACLEQGVTEALASICDAHRPLPGYEESALEPLAQIAHEAAIGFYDEEVAQLTGVESGERVPSIFDHGIGLPPIAELAEGGAEVEVKQSAAPAGRTRCRFNLHPSLYTTAHPGFEWVLIRHPLSRGGEYYHTEEVNPEWPLDHPKRPENRLKPGQEIVARGTKAEILARVRELQEGCF